MNNGERDINFGKEGKRKLLITREKTLKKWMGHVPDCLKRKKERIMYKYIKK